MPELPELGLRSVELEPALEEAELVVIVTAHPDIDYADVAQRRPVIDFRGVLRTSSTAAVPAVD